MCKKPRIWSQEWREWCEPRGKPVCFLFLFRSHSHLVASWWGWRRWGVSPSEKLLACKCHRGSSGCLPAPDGWAGEWWQQPTAWAGGAGAQDAGQKRRARTNVYSAQFHKSQQQGPRPLTWSQAPTLVPRGWGGGVTSCGSSFFWISGLLKRTPFRFHHEASQNDFHTGRDLGDYAGPTSPGPAC